ncbi:splicing factor 3B subunit 2 [Trichonephila inaurata madagascariensis]|uniref:Splicing factor 3B subunit 2 n=1 Tax=Trichonephila inaurata madagascariensis TaxID=2747483 RepID=A0A8X6MHK6_9ARAC|nr:splicing factor 3B subunit 2 [Trichonephila inaurata madagascariensis]
MFKQRVHFKNDRYEVELPRKRDSDELSDNFNLEKRRLESHMRKMQSDRVLYSEYCKVFRNYLGEGIIEKVKNPFISTNDPVLYFPHLVIIKNESLTTKQQIVFDASACERKVLKEKMGSEKSDEDMELPQTTEKVLPLESERAKMLSVGLDVVAQPVTVPEEKGLTRVLLISANEMCVETSVDVIKETAKEDINLMVLSKEPVNLDDEIEEVKQKVCFNPNLKASRNVIFVQHHWRKYSQVLRGVEKSTRKLPFIQRPTVRKKVRFKSRMSDIDSPKLQNSVFKRLAKPKVPIQGDLMYEGKTVTPALWDGRDEEKIGKRETPFPLRWTPAGETLKVKSDPFSRMTGALKSTWRTKGEKQR